MTRSDVAIELFIFKAKTLLSETGKAEFDVKDINEVLITAGRGVITPDSLTEKDIEVII